MNKKILCIALSLLMVLTILPVQSFAANGNVMIDKVKKLTNVVNAIDSVIKPIPSVSARTYTVTYETADGMIEDLEVKAGTKITFVTFKEPMDPLTVDYDVYISAIATDANDAYECVGWTAVKNPLTGNYVFTAKWVEKDVTPVTTYKLTYNNGEKDITRDVVDGSVIFVTAGDGKFNDGSRSFELRIHDDYKITAVPTLEGYTFDGWELDDWGGFYFFYPIWKANAVADYTITFKTFVKLTTDGAVILTDSAVTAAAGSLVSVMAETYDDGMIYGKYEGYSSKEFYLTADKTLANATAPAGYVFSGWEFEGESALAFTATYVQSVPEEYTVTYSKYVKDANVTLGSIKVEANTAIVINPNGGVYLGSGNVVNQNITANTEINDPTNLYKHFNGWKCTSSLGVYTLTAQWKQSGTYAEYDACDKTTDGCYITGHENIQDVFINAWYHDGIHFCLQNDIMTANGNYFAPKADATREEVIMGLYALSNNAPAASYEEAAAWAVAEEIFKGYGEEVGTNYSLLRPNDPITREQLATVIARYFEVNADQTTDKALTFKDAVKIAAFARNSVKWTVNSGILIGFNDGSFNPKGNVSRAQLATIFLRINEFEGVIK